MDYQVDLDSFRGPLDLLLYLVKRNEVDVCDIPIAKVAEQFVAHLNLLNWVDVERVGDFLVMAATLMEIKSKLLLPTGSEEGIEEEDPRKQLVQQLLEYKRFKDAATLLEGRADEHATRVSRLPLETAGPRDAAEQPLHRVELWDLVSAFGRLMRETLALQPKQIVVDETPLQIYMEQIVGRLERASRLSFIDLFEPPYQRGRLVGLFLAILELIKGRRIIVEQEEVFGVIWVSKAETPTLTAASANDH